MTFRKALSRARPYSLLSEDKLRVIFDLAQSTSGLEGDLAELGVYMGGTAILMLLAAPEATIRLFDTFCGIPKDKCDPAIDRHVAGEFAFGLSGITQRFSEIGRAETYPGIFPKSAKGARDSRFRLVHLD
ncbi:MAG: hypothetical protein KGL39_27775, partial [Patescibacteria group bacterium]|nr:hypothetical protein [Patescibacteria group bacterium]